MGYNAILARNIAEVNTKWHTYIKKNFISYLTWNTEEDIIKTSNTGEIINE